MARNVEFDPAFFETILKSEGAAKLCKEQADAVLAVAQSTAPVDTGDYKAGLGISRNQVRDRVGYVVTGSNWKTLLVESQTGNLQRAVRRVTGGR